MLSKADRSQNMKGNIDPPPPPLPPPHQPALLKALRAAECLQHLQHIIINSPCTFTLNPSHFSANPITGKHDNSCLF